MIAFKLENFIDTVFGKLKIFSEGAQNLLKIVYQICTRLSTVLSNKLGPLGRKTLFVEFHMSTEVCNVDDQLKRHFS